MKINYKHPLVLFRWLISRFIIIDNYCKLCGKNTESFYINQTLWNKVMGEDSQLEVCFKCFHKTSKRKSLSLCYTILEAK